MLSLAENPQDSQKSRLSYTDAFVDMYDIDDVLCSIE